MSRISILDQWKFHNGTNFRMQQLRQNQITPSLVKQMIASERTQSTGQHMKRPFLSIPATSGGFPRNYDASNHAQDCIAIISGNYETGPLRV